MLKVEATGNTGWFNKQRTPADLISKHLATNKVGRAKHHCGVGSIPRSPNVRVRPVWELKKGWASTPHLRAGKSGAPGGCSESAQIKACMLRGKRIASDPLPSLLISCTGSSF